jgi:hypothetical protein
MLPTIYNSVTTSYIPINSEYRSQWTKDLNVKPETFKLHSRYFNNECICSFPLQWAENSLAEV